MAEVRGLGNIDLDTGQVGSLGDHQRVALVCELDEGGDHSRNLGVMDEAAGVPLGVFSK